MNHPERSAQEPSLRTGLLATLRALLRHRGTGAPSFALVPISAPLAATRASHRLASSAIGAATLLVGMLLLVPTASADPRIGASNSLGPGGISQTSGVAVSDREAGDLYVLDGNYSQRVDQFKPNGEFVRAFGWGIVPGAAAGTGDLTQGSTSITDVTTTTGAFATSYYKGAGKFITGPGIPPDTEIAGVTANSIELSNPAEATATGAPLSVAAGPGNVPTNEVQRLTVHATSGQFQLTFTSPKPGSTSLGTTGISFNAPASGAGSVQEALEGLADLGPGSVSVSGGPGGESGESPYLIEFKGRYADTNVHPLSATSLSLTGGSPSSEAILTTKTEGAGALETCTTVCTGASAEEGTTESGNGTTGSEPGQLDYPDAIAVGNDESSASYGDVYVVDTRNFRVERYSPEGRFELMIGGEVDKTKTAEFNEPGNPHGITEAEENLCTAADLTAGDTCGAGVPGTGPSHFYEESPPTGGGGSFAVKSWDGEGNNSIAVGPDGTVYVGDYGRIQEFTPEGAFAGEFVLPLEAGEEPQFVSSLALDSAGDVYERSATQYRDGIPTTQVPGVREYNPAHTLVSTFDAESGSEPTHIALDQRATSSLSDFHSAEFPKSGCGISELSGCPEETFRAFKPGGALYAEFSSDQVS